MKYDSVSTILSYTKNNLVMTQKAQDLAISQFVELVELERTQPEIALKFARMLAASYAEGRKKVVKTV